MPVPLEFTDKQIYALLKNADYCFVGSIEIGDRIKKILSHMTLILPTGEIICKGDIFSIPKWPELSEQSIIKVIHTSGTTSSPKGVKITDQGLAILINSLISCHSHLSDGIHYFSLVPLSLLIEQVLGFYLPLLTQGSLTLLPNQLPPFGYQLNEARQYLELFKHVNVNFSYMPPKLLELLEDMVNQEKVSKELIFNNYVPHIITGGARINKEIIEKLDNSGISIYEAYGLSENSSIISINTIAHRRIGSAGKILPHTNYKIVNDELLIKSPTLSPGYLVKDVTSCDLDNESYLKTGDLIEFSEDGFIYVKGRIKNLIILSNARNIAPEWVESLLKESDEILEAVALGDGMESLTALIFPRNNAIDWQKIWRGINLVNLKLPDFAQITKTIIINDPEAIRKSYYTVTGRPKRDLIAKDYLN